MGLCVFSAALAFFEFECKSNYDLGLSEFGICIYVAGAVGGAFLPRGAMLTRLVVSLSAFFTAMFCGLAIEFDGLSHWLIFAYSLVIIYSWISIIILVISKKHIA